MLKSGKSRFAAVLAIAAIGAGIVAAPAAAQNQQQGLVNIAIEDVIVQVPIAVAANVCDVNVAVLAQIDDEAAACEATATSMATAGPSSNGPPTRQEGLVNVLVDDVLVQAPIAIAANICDVNVAVLAEIDDAAETCVATADAAAQPGPGQGGGGGLVIDIPIHINLDNITTTDGVNQGGSPNDVSPGTIVDPLPFDLRAL